MVNIFKKNIVFSFFLRGFLSITRQSALSIIFIITELQFEAKMTIELFLIFYYLILQVRYQPFTSAKLNNLEQFSLIASVLSLFAGFLFNYPISNWLKETITFFIIFINLCFIMNFFLSILRIWLSSSHNKLKKFCPCLLRASIIVWKSNKMWNSLI